VVRGDNWDRVSIDEILRSRCFKDKSTDELDPLVIPRHPCDSSCGDSAEGNDGSGATIRDELPVVLLAVLNGGVFVRCAVKPILSSWTTPDGARNRQVCSIETGYSPDNSLKHRSRRSVRSKGEGLPGFMVSQVFRDHKDTRRSITFWRHESNSNSLIM